MDLQGENKISPEKITKSKIKHGFAILDGESIFTFFMQEESKEYECILKMILGQRNYFQDGRKISLEEEENIRKMFTPNAQMKFDKCRELAAFLEN